MRRSFLLATVTLFALVACDDKQALRVQETRSKLLGTWLREIETEVGKGRRVLVLSQDGKFSETLVVNFPDGRKGREERAGDWAYDGINLKRRYTHEDGRQVSGNFNFATFELTKLTDSEFEGKNHVQGEEIRYRRVAEGTNP